MFSVVSHRCETWTYSKAIDYKINAFEMLCYRRMLRISSASYTTNIDIIQIHQINQLTNYWGRWILGGSTESGRQFNSIQIQNCMLDA